MSSVITPYLPMLRQTQRRLMTDTMDVVRNGATIYQLVPCRATSNRLFAEPGDPQDANMRSMSEWGITYPIEYDLAVGDTVTVTTPTMTMSIILGEVVEGDTWITAGRAWGNRPKVATPRTTVILYRFNIDTEIWTELPPQQVNVVYDRNEPDTTPARFAPGGRSSYKGGWLIGDLTLNVRMDDRFTMEGIGAVITDVLPLQPQHREARFVMDMTGVE